MPVKLLFYMTRKKWLSTPFLNNRLEAQNFGRVELASVNLLRQFDSTAHIDFLVCFLPPVSPIELCRNQE